MLARVGVVVALLLALLGGWLWGASGRAELDRALRVAQSRNDLLEVRASLLGARVSLCDADFGEMTRQLTVARGFVGDAAAWGGARGVSDQAPHLDLAGFGAEIDEAQRLAARLVLAAAVTR